MNVQISRISLKIEQLRSLDFNLSLFGAQTHQYKFNPVVSVEKIRQFEQIHQVTLPAEYVEFITNVSNGGVGPYYGLEPFENCLFYDLDNKSNDYLINPGMPFHHTKAWNMEFSPTVDEEADEGAYEEEFASFQQHYFDKEYLTGVIAICNYGCGISLNLVVNGQEYGNIWTDDRASDNGIYPSMELGNENRITFLDWYELWLDNSIIEMTGKGFLKDGPVINGKNQPTVKKNWWKFW